ncbi:GD21154 [Drosophila simulans]|uniref:GD21154 n=1 Tax=Drosophila simulans TaxID=7240 RepID=B4QU85_DROSI|nr:GD21154 [Drosophila simulans]
MFDTRRRSGGNLASRLTKRTKMLSAAKGCRQSGNVQFISETCASCNGRATGSETSQIPQFKRYNHKMTRRRSSPPGLEELLYLALVMLAMVLIPTQAGNGNSFDSPIELRTPGFQLYELTDWLAG